MPNILVNIEKGVEVGAEDLLKWLGKGQQAINAAPPVIAAVGTLLGAVASAITTTEAAAAAGGVNITLDTAAFNAIKGVWPQIVAAAAEVGIKL